MESISKKEQEEHIPEETIIDESWQMRLAHIISEITNPLFVALPTLLLVALHTSPDLSHALLWWGITAVGISAAPFLFILRGVRRGHYTDHHVSRREQRLIPLLFGLSCVALVLVLLFLLQASRPLIATIIATLLTGIIAAVITRYWKISMHLIGMAGSVTVFVLLFGPLAYLLTPLVVLVGWARWRVRAHTILQAMAGILLATAVTVATFWLAGLCL